MLKRTGHDLDLGNTVRITENDTDLGGSRALPGQLADLVDNLLRRGLEPRRRVARVGDGRARDTLALAMKTTHGDWLLWCRRRRLDYRVSRWLVGDANKISPNRTSKLEILWAEKLARADL